MSKLDSEIQFLKGVGPARAADFNNLGIVTVRDLLFTFPRAIADRSNVTTIADTPGEGEAVVIAELRNFEERRLRGFKARTLTRAMFTDHTGEMEAVWFNAPWVKDQLAELGARATLLLYGKVNRKSGWLKMEQPRFERTVDGIAQESLHAGRMVPLYPCTGGLNQNSWRRIMDNALQQALDELPELYPPDYLREHDLMGRREAVRNLHFPENEDARGRARARLAWDEALLLQLVIAERRAAFGESAGAAVFPVSRAVDAHIRALLPFRPTAAQEKVIAEISSDLASPVPMHRLLQGDVGSGKTAVAAYAMLAVVAGGAQACLLAPTALLAQQHFQTLEKLLANSKRSTVGLRLLTSGMKKAERELLKIGLKNGTVDLLVATHAALSADIVFRRLGLAVIDEQHKFGVAQREKITAKTAIPNVLVMTATPIPRSLALTVYGDLDVSVIDGLPPGRQPVKSTVVDASRLPQVWEFIRSELCKGRQAFIVSPVVEESEEMLSAKEAFENFRANELADFSVGLLHGQMSREEQAEIMAAFRARQLDALVSTVVIEVGVDVPNANVMLVLHAERFGLAQLHQLRGRIGRGREKGHFIMFASSDGDIATRRLQVMCETTDGFKIAEADLRLRGPGEFLGTKQHGAAGFKVLDLVEDLETVLRARAEAPELLGGLASPSFAALAAEFAEEKKKREEDGKE